MEADEPVADEPTEDANELEDEDSMESEDPATESHGVNVVVTGSVVCPEADIAEAMSTKYTCVSAIDENDNNLNMLRMVEPKT